ncbi:MAG: four helix bundle protein [Desulfatiglandales bacterium]
MDLLIHRESQAEHIRFLETAFGSLRELHDQLGLSKRLGYSYEREISTCESKIVEARRFWAPCFDQCADSEGLGN